MVISSTNGYSEKEINKMQTLRAKDIIHNPSRLMKKGGQGVSIIKGITFENKKNLIHALKIVK